MTTTIIVISSSNPHVNGPQTVRIRAKPWKCWTTSVSKYNAVYLCVWQRCSHMSRLIVHGALFVEKKNKLWRKTREKSHVRSYSFCLNIYINFVRYVLDKSIKISLVLRTTLRKFNPNLFFIIFVCPKNFEHIVFLQFVFVKN